MSEPTTAHECQIVSRHVRVGDLIIHYLTAGEGEPVVLLHGWPTWSYLWRHVIPPLATSRRVIAPDLVGFGQSDKPQDAPYTVGYHADMLHGFLAELGVERTALVVHDIGGPVGLLWAIREPQRLERLAILNTFLLPEVSVGLRLVLASARVPGLKDWLASPAGIANSMRIGMADKRRLSRQTIAAYQLPFLGADSRKVLLRTIQALLLTDLEPVARALPKLDVPVRLIVGAQDFVLAPDMHRLERVLPGARSLAIPDCGHYLQEDQPGRLSELLAEFLAE